MAARQITTLFIRAHVNDEVEHSLVDAEYIEQDARLGSGPISGDAPALRLQAEQQITQRGLKPPHLGRKAAVKIEFPHAPAGFLSEQAPDRLALTSPRVL